MVAPLRATLREISLRSPDPAQLVNFYQSALGYSFNPDGWGLLGTARGRRLRLSLGAAKTLDYAGYAVDTPEDLAALRSRLGSARVDVEICQAPGFTDGALAFSDPDGNCFVFGVALSQPGRGDCDQKTDQPARIQHLVFASTDPKRLLDFYIDVLGFQLSDRVLDDKGELRTAFVRCSKEHHSLAVFAAPDNRLDHHCYETTDWNMIRDWSDHFAKLHIPLKWGPGRHGPGHNLFIFVHDPDGNWVELSAELEHVADDRPAADWPHEERTLNSWVIWPPF